ncbi:MAG: energy transducer TonB [Candidatus Sulfotelmatobacter sp.]
MAESPLAVASPEITAPLTPAPKTEVMQASVAADVPLHAAAPISASISTAKQTIHEHATTPARTLPLHDQNNGMNIEASRPPLRFAYPDYTDVRAHGIVSLTAGVDPTGAVRNVRFISGNRALAAAAARAIRQWRYRPYLKDDRAVATETNIVISFFSNDAISLSFPPSIATNR